MQRRRSSDTSLKRLHPSLVPAPELSDGIFLSDFAASPQLISIWRPSAWPWVRTRVQLSCTTSRRPRACTCWNVTKRHLRRAAFRRMAGDWRRFRWQKGQSSSGKSAAALRVSSTPVLRLVRAMQGQNRSSPSASTWATQVSSFPPLIGHLAPLPLGISPSTGLSFSRLAVMTLEETLEHVRFEWTADRSVQLKIRGVILTFST